MKRPSLLLLNAALISIIAAVGCGDAKQTSETTTSASTTAPLRFSDWTSAQNVGTPVNTDQQENDPFITADGLSLYFQSNRSGGLGAGDLYVAHRTNTNAPWGAAVNLGALINSAADDGHIAISPDGLTMFFNSNRLGGLGGTDLYMSRRSDPNNDFGWQAPLNLGAPVNTSSDEYGPGVVRDPVVGSLLLYFASNRPGSQGDDDIFTSVQLPDGTFGDPFPIVELNTSARERHPFIRRDGLEIFFMSNRPGSMTNAAGNPSFDIWTATRSSVNQPWSTPVNAGPIINTPRHDAGPALSADGTTLYFFSAQRQGNIGATCPDGASCFFDIWTATRTRQ
jgi:hypothetical protein